MKFICLQFLQEFVFGIIYKLIQIKRASEYYCIIKARILPDVMLFPLVNIILNLCLIYAIYELIFVYKNEDRKYFYKVSITKEDNKIREMTEAEKWIYLKHKTLFCAVFLKLHLAVEIIKAKLKGNVVDYLSGKIVYAVDKFQNIIILKVSDIVNEHLSIEGQISYVQKFLNRKETDYDK